ncbi:MAG: radical SAM protein [Pseudomonadota bacterium]
MKDGLPPSGTIGKFQHPDWTAQGERRATVALGTLQTLWFNTGTLCNIACLNCYIESSPTNDRLEYITPAEVRRYLDELDGPAWSAREIGFTGGEPFLNPGFLEMLGDCLERGYAVLVLTNAMKPMMRPRVQAGLKALHAEYGDQLTLRVSLDHFAAARHDDERGAGSFAASLKGMDWIRDAGLRMGVAGRTMWDEPEAEIRAGFAKLFQDRGYDIDASDPAQCVLFPEMDAQADVPEITTACWGILGKRPESVMCATSRMVVKRRGAARPSVLACTLLPYEAEFELGETLSEAARPVALNHPHCAKFCVLGGASCSA